MYEALKWDLAAALCGVLPVVAASLWARTGRRTCCSPFQQEPEVTASGAVGDSTAEMELFLSSCLLPAAQLAFGKDRTVFAFAQNSNNSLNSLCFSL